ncbi:MAG: polysulfide reductase NrfD, partial [Candidatus Eremiobacteraeota bacterium]|nr:polysulfide reductase NrfD [Candidatus Eremiobacteraeota bacterium]
LGGVLISGALLTLDLGVPLRFYKMLRVFKPTSPMSVGSWLLTAFGGALAGSTVAELLGMKLVSTAGEVAAAAMGPFVTTYTAALIADTATPIWHEAHDRLPLVFVASGVAGAGALGVLFLPAEKARASRRLMLAGSIGLGVSMESMKRRLGKLLAEPYKKGRAGSLARTARGLGLGAVLTAFFGRKSALAGRAAAVLTVAAGIVERYAILQAGKQSADDPKYVVEHQRAKGDNQTLPEVVLSKDADLSTGDRLAAPRSSP